MTSRTASLVKPSPPPAVAVSGSGLVPLPLTLAGEPDRSHRLTILAAPGRMQVTTETSTGDDRDEYLAGTSKRTAVAAKRDPERQRRRPSSRAPNHR